MEETAGAWSCTIELPELQGQYFREIICPPVETLTDGTRNYVPVENRRLFGLNLLQEEVAQFTDCQMVIQSAELPIRVNSDGVSTEVVRTAIEHILHCRLSVGGTGTAP